MNRFSTKSSSRSSILFKSFFLLFAGSFGIASAGTIQTPTGLVAGDTFRIIFVTSGKIDATSANISTYDNFVNADAAGTTYNGVLVNWKAIGSTATTNAINHIGTSPVAGVYMANGTKVATSTNNASANGLWKADGLLAQPNQGLDGTVYSGFVWTGTNGKGLEYKTTNVNLNTVRSWGLGRTVNELPNNPFPELRSQVGVLPGTPGGYDWVSSAGLVKPQTDKYQMYGISDVLFVPVPEPSTFACLGIGLLVIAARGMYRKNKANVSLT